MSGHSKVMEEGDSLNQDISEQCRAFSRSNLKNDLYAALFEFIESSSAPILSLVAGIDCQGYPRRHSEHSLHQVPIGVTPVDQLLYIFASMGSPCSLPFGRLRGL